MSPYLIEVVNQLNQAKIGLKSLNDPIDNTTAQGRLAFTILTSLAEFERELIRERTQAGLSAARARGRKGGRPKGLPAEAEKTAYAADVLYYEVELCVRQIAAKLSLTKREPVITLSFSFKFFYTELSETICQKGFA